jgi:alpha-galactosidase
MLKTERVIAIDQDPIGAQGRLIQQSGLAQVWVKPLASGAVAVALFNRGTSDLRIATSARRVGLPAANSYQVDDLWANTTTTMTDGTIGGVVPGRAVILCRAMALS